jgi:hypothetical protein
MRRRINPKADSAIEEILARRSRKDMLGAILIWRQVA